MYQSPAGQPTSFPTTYATLQTILEDLDSLRDRVQGLLDNQAVRRTTRSNGNFGMGTPTMNSYAYRSQYPGYDPWSFNRSYSAVPNPMRPCAVLSPSPTLSSPLKGTFRERKNAGGWAAPVTRGPPKIGRSAPERRGRRDEGKKVKGRKRRRVKSEESSEESESEEDDDDDDDKGSRDRDIAGDRDEGRGGEDGLVLGVRVS